MAMTPGPQLPNWLLPDLGSLGYIQPIALVTVGPSVFSFNTGENDYGMDNTAA